SVVAANAVITQPTINLCIAQQLRGQSPGTAGGEALLLSSANQRQLLETIRERVQLAMLSFSQLAVAFTQPDLTVPTTLMADQAPLPIVIKWARDSNNGQFMTGMGTDFAAAVQLHTVVMAELADLYARASSAREPRGGHAKSRAEEIWGPGSWRQR